MRQNDRRHPIPTQPHAVAAYLPDAHPARPLVLREAKFEGTGPTARTTTDFPPCPDACPASSAAREPALACLARRQQSPWQSVPVTLPQRYETDTRCDDILCGHGTTSSCHNKSANRIPPREFKEDVLSWIAHLLLPGTRSITLHCPDPRCRSVISSLTTPPRCRPSSLLRSYESYVSRAFLVGSLGDRICKNTWVCYPKHVLHKKTTKTRTECFKLKIKHILWFCSFFCLIRKWK